MAITKKGKRKITVGNQLYYWSTRGEDYSIALSLMTDFEGSGIAFCHFDYHHIPVKQTNKYGEYISLSDQFVITPYIVRQAIEIALENGWKPLEKGPNLNLGSLDEKIDLRLDKNRVSNFKRAL